VLEVENLALPSPPGTISRPALQGISFTLRRGEVLGVAGLLGAGRTELLEALFGASPLPPSGTIRLDGRPVRFRHPAEAIDAGIALVTEDRKNLGLFDRMTVGENITIAHLSGMAGPAGTIQRRTERRAIQHAIERHHIKTAGGAAAVTSLSGGNQQKCILARWLLSTPRVLLLDEPTRGIDVGAKAEIYLLIRNLAVHEGLGIVMTSSELPELLAVADRILVLCEGRLTAELPRAEATEERIMHAATQFLDRTAAARAS
jgi:ABC-type sugar transport system ATPase subunit